MSPCFWFVAAVGELSILCLIDYTMKLLRMDEIGLNTTVNVILIKNRA